MALRVANLRLGVLEAEQDCLPPTLAQALGVNPAEIQNWRILKKSLDARDKRDIHFVYSLEASLAEDEEQLAERAGRRSHLSIERYHEPPFETPPYGERPLSSPPVIIGAGPAGLFAAYLLAQHGYAPLVLERGRPVKERIEDVRAFDRGGGHDPESNYLFGEGGAGTFSDGKLTCRSTGPDVRRVLEIFAQCKGKPSIVYDHRPHLGSNRLPAVVKALRRQIEAWGGEFRFSCRVEDLAVADGAVRGVVTGAGRMPVDVAVLAIGHSARDTYQMLLARGVPMIQKPFQIGLRIEQPQEQVNRIQYGADRLELALGAADYTLTDRKGRSVFTFCMCAGGQVIASVSEPGRFCTNGMSLSRRASPFANSGLMVTLSPSEFGSSHVLAGMHLQRALEERAFGIGGDYRCPIQWAEDFLARRATTSAPPSSYCRGLAPCDLSGLAPPVVEAAVRECLPRLDARWQGNFLRQATLVGPEARGSSPVRLSRHPETMEAEGISGLYPIGEGAGYAGGIVSAALDGLRAAKAIIALYAPLRPAR